MSAFLEGIGKVLGKITDHVQGRIERLKNEKAKLLAERAKLLSGVFSASSSARIIVIDNRVSEINTILGNKATD